jgi:16S rRNA (cytosine967-C5)-methyltransferase
MRVSDHAAVKETVEVAKYVAGESKASYVNAILRKVVADGFLIPESKDWPTIERLSIEYSHPQWIIQSFYEQLKDWQEVEDLLKANNTPVQPDLVCWVGKSNLKQIVELGGKPIDGLNEGFTISGIPSEFLPVMERRVGVQDRGSQLVVEDFLATAKPNLKWLDMCAGPGGKAAYFYHYLVENFPESIFVANEINKVRAELVKRVVSNNHVITNDGTNASAFLGRFDRILIDAPCTGLGALRRRPEARWRKSPQDLKGLVSLQRKLLRSAYELLNPGGIIAYVTCSPHLSETKGQVLDFLGSYNEMKLLSLKSISLKNSSGLQDDGTMQLWTHRNNSDSMFMALFQREVVE